MEHKTRTKALSWLLSLALMLSVLPTIANAAEEYETIVTATAGQTTYQGQHFKVIGDSSTSADSDGLSINSYSGYYAKVSSLNGENITKLILSLYSDDASRQPAVYVNGNAVNGSYSGKTFTVENINSTELEIRAANTGMSIRIKQLDIYYGSAHTHTFTYNASGDTITATCAQDCPDNYGKNPATLTIAAPLHTAVGDGKSASATLTGLDAFNTATEKSVAETNIVYIGSGETSYTEQAKAPTDAGTYTAKITVEGAAAAVDYEITNPDYSVTLLTGLTGGNITADKTTAKYGETVTLTVTPGSDDYSLKSLTVKDGDSNDVTVEDYKFTMPASNVTVSATFGEKSSAAVSLALTGNNGTTCKASLLNSAYVELASGATVREGDQFILSVNADDEYDYTVTFAPSPSGELKDYIKAFTNEEYQDYAAYINAQNKSLPSDTGMFWVTMPGLSGQSLTINTTFAKANTYTILYQPTENPEAVWCKFTKTVNNQDQAFAVKMKHDAVMGNTAVWSTKVTAAFDPSKIAFTTSESGVESATLENATVSQAANWNNITGGQYLIIGGNAKTVIAAFVADASAVSDYDNYTATFSAGKGSGVTYQIALCGTDDSGNVTAAGTVTAPAAPTKDGYDFAGWRVLEGTAPNKTETVYNAGNTINVSENTTFNAVWNHSNPNIKLNLNGGTGGSSVTSVTYNTLLTIAENPTREGYAFDGWTVSKAVTENSVFFDKDSTFDFNTPITADLELTAQWKHVHYYYCMRINDLIEYDLLPEDYAKYDTSLHAMVCDCYDTHTEAHSFGSDGKCACGFEKPVQKVTLNVSYGQWSDNTYTAKMQEFPQEATKDQEVSVSAPDTWGSLKFSKWQYSTNNGSTWKDLSAYLNVSFIIPCNMKVRALYINPTTNPEVNLSATTYPVFDNASGKYFDSILFQMNYKLPDGYTYVDSGVKAGDNEGISYYEFKEIKRTAGERAAWGAMNAGVSYAFGGVLSAIQDGVIAAVTLENDYYYEKRENSVLDEMTAQTLSDYMYQSKPVNVEKYPPIYWEYRPTAKGQSGSLNALIPVGCAQKNNQDHYLYGIAYLRYKDRSGTVRTIYTPALPTTLNGVGGSSPVTKTGS